MTFSVKIRSNGGEWQVEHGVTAGSFITAERMVRRQYATQMGLPESCFDVQAYRSDSKSVWQAK